MPERITSHFAKSALRDREVRVNPQTLALNAGRTRRARAAFEKMMKKGPKEYSWFILRVTNQTIRELFMHPANSFRVLEALMSMLVAGDIYGKTPLWGRCAS